MKNQLALCFLLFTSALHAAELELTIKNVASDKGQVFLQVFNSESTWMTEDAVFRKIIPAAQLQKNATVVLPLDYGEYGISVFHDVDGNNELNTNWIGIPNEPVGMSNDAKGKMGPAKYKDAKFLFNEKSSTHTLTLYDI